jgi:hypothetical protein
VDEQAFFSLLYQKEYKLVVSNKFLSCFSRGSEQGSGNFLPDYRQWLPIFCITVTDLTGRFTVQRYSKIGRTVWTIKMFCYIVRRMKKQILKVVVNSK